MTMEPKEAARLLRSAYETRGYIRVKMDQRQGGKRSGWEIRLRASSVKEARLWSASLKLIGLRPGRAYQRSASTIVVPLYGREQVESFLRRLKPRSKSSLPNPPGDTDLRQSNSGT